MTFPGAAALWTVRTALASAADPFFSCSNVTLGLLLSVAAQQSLLGPSEVAWRAAGLIVLAVGQTPSITDCTYANASAGQILQSHGATLESNGTFTGAFDVINEEITSLFTDKFVDVFCLIDEVRVVG
jgi:hypothetical protein